MRQARLLHLIGIVALGATVLMACSFGGGASSSASGGTSTAPGGGTTTAPTVTPLPAVASCSAALPGAGAASGGASFGDVPYPAGAVATGLTLHHSGTGDWTISLQQACTASSSVSTVRSFYATQLPAHSWTVAATLPFNGSLQAPCGDPYCWGKDAAPRYVGLESPTDRGGGIVTYQLRFFVPPTAPNCTAGDTYGIYTGKSYETTWDEASVPLPPLTIFGIGDGYSMPAFNHDAYVGMCSAGTATSVTNFFQTALPSQGWSYGALPTLFSVCGGSAPGWYKGHTTFSFVTTGPIASGISWQMAVCVVH